VLKSGEVLVWRASLDRIRDDSLPPLLPEERERAARFHSEEARSRYARSHGVLRAILASLGVPAVFVRDPCGKPRLKSDPEIGFSLSRSKGVALYAVAMSPEVGADIEQVRPIPEYLEIAERFFPPDECAALLLHPNEQEFFRRWTRIEATLKARGVGLYGAGTAPPGEWTVADVDAGPGLAAAVAISGSGWQVSVRDYA
jgi:4'-phosphopantetheinyl transferase